MSYTESLFASGESLVTSARQHWFVLIWNMRYAVLALLGAAILFWFGPVSGRSGTLFTILGWITLALFVAGIAWIVWGWVRYRNEEYVITTRRLIHVSGVINKRASDSSLEKINDAILTESLFGRMFGFGDLEVLTASDAAGIETLHMLRDAKEFKKSMLEAKHDLELEISRPTMPPLRVSTASSDEGATDRVSTLAEPVPAPAPAPAPAPVPAPATPAPAGSPPMTSEQVADALNRLGDLRDRGIVTPAEFEAKKAELLARL